MPNFLRTLLSPSLSRCERASIVLDGGRTALEIEAHGVGRLRCGSYSTWVFGSFRQRLLVPVAQGDVTVVFRGLVRRVQRTVELTPTHAFAALELPRVDASVPRVRRVPSQLDHAKLSCQSALPKPSIDFAQLRRR